MSRGSSVGIVTRLRAGRSGVRIPVGARLFFSSPERPDLLWGPSSLLFAWGKNVRGVSLTSHLHLVPKFRLSGAVPPLVYSFMTCAGASVTVKMERTRCDC